MAFWRGTASHFGSDCAGIAEVGQNQKRLRTNHVQKSARILLIFAKLFVGKDLDMVDLSIESLNSLSDLLRQAQQLNNECILILNGLGEMPGETRGGLHNSFEKECPPVTWVRVQRVLRAAGRGLSLRAICEALNQQGKVVRPESLRRALARKNDVFRFIGRSRFALVEVE